MVARASGLSCLVDCSELRQFVAQLFCRRGLSRRLLVIVVRPCPPSRDTVLKVLSLGPGRSLLAARELAGIGLERHSSALVCELGSNS